MDKKDVLERLHEEKIEFLQLQFIDIFGVYKNVEVPTSQFDKALSGEIMFDGSSIEGFTRIEESDMVLKPDLDTFMIYSFEDEDKIGRVICDVYRPDGSAFLGCPRVMLKKVIKEANDMGYSMMLGPELEFFLFCKDENGHPTLKTQDDAGYFDMAPVDEGEVARRDIIDVLISLGFEVEASHHEVAIGQHEIDFKYEDALRAADNITSFKFVTKKIASRHGLHATFMPKPIFGINGSGMHCNQSLYKNGENAFYDPKADMQLSKTTLHYIAGIMEHIKAAVAITNPLVNSYKRLVPGYEAPVNIAWSEKNRSPLIRVPASRGKGTRIEVRVPDPSCNPYLAIAVMLKAGLDGIKRNLQPPPPVNKNIFTMSDREKARLKIGPVPANLSEALHYLKKDKIVQDALGEHIYNHFYRSKKFEWDQYISQVHGWEVERYLKTY